MTNQEQTAKNPWILKIVQKGYRDLAMEVHPDRGGSNEEMREVNAAKETLEELIEGNGTNTETETEAESEDYESETETYFDRASLEKNSFQFHGKIPGAVVSVNNVELAKWLIKQLPSVAIIETGEVYTLPLSLFYQ